MNRGFLLSLLSCGLLVTAVGCGDDDGSGGSGGGATTSSTTTGNNTTSTTKATTGAMMTTSSTTGSSMAATCESYCAAIDAVCGTPVGQYLSVDSCLEMCPAFMQGTVGDTSMNTLECRSYHAGAANGMPDPHCIHAGPLGGGPTAGNGCGMMRCSSFCAVAFESCESNAPWATEAECMTDCASIPDDAVDFNVEEIAGDTLACRMYHLSVATEAKVAGDMIGFEEHCGHIAADNSPCGN
jgi:hypothetical protein